jgi:hypothetical protein
MGEARKKRELAARLAADRGALEDAVKQVSHALRKLAQAASAHLGSDCYTHAEIGRELLADLGFVFETQVGFAAWRVGHGDSDIIAHTKSAQMYTPAGVPPGQALPYHAWLAAGDWLVDFTTYQLRHKGALLDAADGGRTQVDWCPDFLLLSRLELRPYKEVVQAPGPGLSYYEADSALKAVMAAGYTRDDADLAHARLVMRNPDVMVMGPNTAGFTGAN